MSYWQKRMEDMMLATEKGTLSYEKKLLDSYEATIVRLQRELDSFFHKYAKDNKITWQEARRILTPKERKDFNSLLKEWYSKVSAPGAQGEQYKKYLDKLGKQLHVSRIEQLTASIRNEIETLKSDQYSGMLEHLALIYEYSYYASYHVNTTAMKVAVNFAAIDRIGVETAIKQKWLENNFSGRIWADRAKLIKALEVLIPRSFSMGMSSTQIAKDLAKQLNASKTNSQALVRTEVNYLANKATLEVYKAIGILKYEFLATLDMKTSEICRGMDGFIGLVEEAVVNVNYPPMHVRCRSTTIPKFEDDGEYSQERIARDEEGNNIKVPRNMTQEEWIQKYVPEEQKERLLSFSRKNYKAE